MTKLLFKLKKDGETVGYEKCQLDNDYDAPKIYNTDGISYHYPKKCQWWYSNVYRLSWCTVREDHDEKCIFVCKDRNGKEVFEGDRVKCLYDNIDLQEAIVGLWNLTWALIDPIEISSKERRYYQLTGYDEKKGNSFDIELIEDADVKGVENER